MCQSIWSDWLVFIAKHGQLKYKATVYNHSISMFPYTEPLLNSKVYRWLRIILQNKYKVPFPRHTSLEVNRSEKAQAGNSAKYIRLKPERMWSGNAWKPHGFIWWTCPSKCPHPLSCSFLSRLLRDGGVETARQAGTSLTHFRPRPPPPPLPKDTPHRFHKINSRPPLHIPAPSNWLHLLVVLEDRCS